MSAPRAYAPTISNASEFDALAVAWCSVCGADSPVAQLPGDDGFGPDEHLCVRCGTGIALLVTSVAIGRSA